MNVAIVHPTVGPDGALFPTSYLDHLFHTLHADGLRCNLDRRYPERNERIADYCRSRFLTLIATLELDDYFGLIEVDKIARYVRDELPKVLRHVGVRYVGIGNEPRSLDYDPRPGRQHMSADVYANIVQVLAPEIRAAGFKVALAGDMMRPNGWFDREHLAWWRFVRDHTEGLMDVCAIHPYREGSPTVTRTHWPDWAHGVPRVGRLLFDVMGRNARTRENTRIAAEVFPRATSPAWSRIAIDEVGWSRNRGTDAEIEGWLRGELVMWEQAGVSDVAVYAHHGPADRPDLNWSVLNEDLTLAPQGRAIRLFQDHGAQQA